MKKIISILVICCLIFIIGCNEQTTYEDEFNQSKIEISKLKDVNIEIEKENYLLKNLMLADIDVGEVSLDSQIAESYYEEAGIAYENQNYNLVSSNCRIARNHFSDESQGYLKIKANLESKELNDSLVTIYIVSMELLSETALNMFEACEHFEVAARYYDTYFNTDVLYNDVSFDMGASEMEMMNKKIKLHDENIRKYNANIEKYGIELKKRLE